MGVSRELVLERLTKAMDAPLTHPGSQEVATNVIEQFADSLSELMARLGDKVLETVSDGERHDTLALTPDRRVALWFVVWPGSHREVQADRVGDYLGEIASKVKLLVDAGMPLDAFLEIDAYIEDSSAGSDSSADNDEALDVSVEYSFVPAELLGGSTSSNPDWRIVLLNRSLLSPSERQAIGKLMT